MGRTTTITTVSELGRKEMARKRVPWPGAPELGQSRRRTPQACDRAVLCSVPSRGLTWGN